MRMLPVLAALVALVLAAPTEAVTDADILNFALWVLAKLSPCPCIARLLLHEVLR